MHVCLTAVDHELGFCHREVRLHARVGQNEVGDLEQCFVTTHDGPLRMRCVEGAVKRSVRAIRKAQRAGKRQRHRSNVIALASLRVNTPGH